MKKRVMKILCAQAMVLSMIASLCGCGASAPKADEATAEIEASNVAASDTILAKSGTAEAQTVSQKNEVNRDNAIPYECADVGVTFYLPEEYAEPLGYVSIDASDLTNGDGVYMITAQYRGLTDDYVQELVEKENPTEEEVNKYYGSFLNLFSLVGIDKNRGSKEICDTVNELLIAYNGDDSELVRESDLTEVSSFEGVTYYIIKPEAQNNYENLDPEFKEEFDLLSSYVDSIIETADYYEPEGIFKDVIGRKLQFETTDLDGNPISSDELFAQHDITMVNVWATWCGWCTDELPELEKINNRLAENNCAIVGLLGDGTDDEHIQLGKDLLAEAGCTYQNIVAFDGWSDQFDMSQGWPTSFLVDSTGTIIALPLVGAQVGLYEDAILDALEGKTDANYNNMSSNSTQNSEGAYRIYVYDEESNPVPGAMIQFCSDDTCNMGQTDADGIATFEKPEGVYKVHVLQAPAGYKADDNEYYTLDTYSDMTIVLDKE